jgi:hypothetical protein
LRRGVLLVAAGWPCLGQPGWHLDGVLLVADMDVVVLGPRAFVVTKLDVVVVEVVVSGAVVVDDARSCVDGRG